MFKKEGKKKKPTFIYILWCTERLRVWRKIKILKKKKRKMANPVLNFETITLANKKNFISS